MQKSRAILLLNLGSPDSPTVPAVRKYLREFLGDGYVISLPWIFRKILLECFILPRRPKKSAALYKRIWTPNGSPLIYETEKLRERLAEKLCGRAKVFCAMRYGNPGVKNALQKIKSEGISEVFIIPLYPQCAESSWITAAEHAKKIFEKNAPEISIRFAKPYYEEPEFIKALAEVAERFIAGKNFEKLLISFHGVPVKTPLAQSYRKECETTGTLLAKALNLPENRWEVAFQSHFGKGKWLEPSTECRLENLPRENVKNLAVIAPGFSADCLETLDELAIRGKEKFLKAGGNAFFTIPCLNDSESFVKFLSELFLRNFPDI
ncbi:MAG: ferrochelatase [Opitutales bacterium]|nr:ferrochelatase [Opitutales bacterium]